MFKFKLSAVKNVVGLVSAALVFSAGVFATELTPIDDGGGVVTIQCLTNPSGTVKLCCTGHPTNMTCDFKKV